MKRLSCTLAMATCMALPLQASADLFTVNSTADPAVGDPLNCTAGSPGCTFRDALAAADLTPQPDTIVFAVGGTIHLNRALSATQPVTIDGGGTTTVRVAQGYGIAILQDRPVFGSGPVPVLQPDYYSAGGALRPMLSLQGAGSAVHGLELDGSITPNPADLGLARIDYESDGTTNYLLYTVDSGSRNNAERWPIAGGIYATGNATVSGNELSYLDNSGVTVDFAQFTVITDNVITGGAAGQPGYSADGITLYGCVYSTVSDNTVSGFRNGINFTFSSGIEVSGNELTGNALGLSLDNVGPDYGPIVVVNNEANGNLVNGIFVYQALGPQIADNEVSGNGVVGIHIKEAGQIGMVDNEVSGNGAGAFDHGGILINEGSGYVSVVSNEVSANAGFGVVIAESFANVLSGNALTDNAGAGLALLNGAQYNQVESNTVKWNAVGVVAGLEGDANFPSDNTYQNNEILENAGIDALDYDPVCNDLWAGNTIGTAAAASGACIDQ